MEKRKLNNEGFSLIELIIVIAIMAILVGALAPQLMKYIEKSRQSTDIQAIGALYTALQTALADPDVNSVGFGGGTLSSTDGNYDFSGETHAVWQECTNTISNGKFKLSSDAYAKQDIAVSVSGNSIVINVRAKPNSTGYDLTVNESGSNTASDTKSQTGKN